MFEIRPVNPVRVVTGVPLRPNAAGGPWPEILLGKRKGQRFYQDCWETAGGKVEVGESDVGALTREVWEEWRLKAEVTDPNPVYEGEFVTPTGTPFDIAAYAVNLDTENQPLPLPEHMNSHSAVRWFPLNDALYLPQIAPSLRPIVRAAMARIEAKKLSGGIHILPSGAEVHFDDPSRTPIYASDIALVLGRQRRYGGIVDITVLEHLALCVLLAECEFGQGSAEAAYAGAHDFHETDLPDVTRPMKRRWPGYRPLEDLWEKHNHHALGLEWPVPHALAQRVKAIDDRAPAIEAAVWKATNPEHYFKHHGGMPTVGEMVIGQEVASYRRALVGDGASRALWKDILHPALTRYLNRDPFPQEPPHAV